MLKLSNPKLLKFLGIGITLLGSVFLFVFVISVVYAISNSSNTDLNSETDIESRYISYEEDNSQLAENNTQEITENVTQNEVVPEKQGVLDTNTSRTIIKVNESLSEDEISDIEEKYNLSFTEDSSLNGVYVVETNGDSNISLLEKDLNVISEKDIPVKMASDTVDWGISRIGADKVWSSGSGNGVKVAVIDTGIQIDHPDLQSNIIQGYDFVNNDSNAMDDNGHGTHVAGIIASVQNQVGTIGASFSAKLMPVKVLNSSGYGYLSDVAKGIYYAADNGARVINLSLGSTVDSPTLRDAVYYASSKGVLVVAAAGNNSGEPCMYPGAYSYAVCVVATDSNNKLASFSNLGGELAAPGVSNYSTYLGSSYRYLSGTSMATPHVSGASALLMSVCSTCKTSEIRTLLRESAIDLGDPGADIIFGYGLVDLVSAINKLNPPQEETPQEPIESPEPVKEPTQENTQQEQKKISQSIKILQPEVNSKKRYTPEKYEDIEIKFALDPISDQSQLEKIVVYLNNESIYTTNKQEDTYTLTTDMLDSSQHWLRVTAFFKDGGRSNDSIIIDMTKFRVDSTSKRGTKSVLGISGFFDLSWLFNN